MYETGTARALGLASIGIGLTEIVASRQVERMMGIGNGQNTGVMRVLGIREIMQGVDILSHDDPTPGIWARVAGDMLDGVVIAMAARQTRRPTGFLAVTAAVLGVVAADIVCASQLARQS